MAWLQQPWRFLGLLAGALLLAYAGSFGNGFHYDDFHSLVENPHLRDLGNLGRFFLDPSLFSSQPERAMYRPLVLVSYAFNYAVGGEALPGYHLVNWGLHLACAFLLFLVGRQLLGHHLAPALGALFFALHPAQAEVVNYISSRSETLAALGCLASLLAYLHWRRGGPGWAYWVSVAALAGALLSKSTAVVWPAVLALAELREPAPRRWRAHLGFWVPALAYILISQAMLAAALGSPVRPLGLHLLTQLKAGGYYLQLVAAPLHLNVEHAFSEATSLLDPPVLLSALLLASLGFLLWRLAGSLVALLAGGAVLALLPASVVPLNVLVNEHRLYLTLALASLGVAVLMAPHRRLAWCGGALLLVLGVLSHQRSAVWRDELRLWQDAVAKAPGMYRAHLHLGGALEAQGRVAEALAHYQRAAQLAPEAVETHYNLGNALRLAGRAEEAVRAYHRALELEPAFFQALLNLGTLYLQGDQPAPAEPLLLRAAQLRPEEARVQLQLGVLFRAQGRLAEAEAAYRRAAALRPDLAEAYYNLGNILFTAGRQGEAVEAYRKTLSLALHPGAFYNLGDLYLRQGDYPRAAEVFERALGQLPGDARFHYGLGRAQDGLGDTVAAAAHYRAFLTSGQAPAALAETLQRRLAAGQNTPQE